MLEEPGLHPLLFLAYPPNALIQSLQVSVPSEAYRG